MIVKYDKSFSKSLDKIIDRKLLLRIENVILKLEKATSLDNIANNKKLTGHKSYYRIKIGTYRLGYEKLGLDTVRLIIFTHRKDIYQKFP